MELRNVQIALALVIVIIVMVKVERAGSANVRSVRVQAYVKLARVMVIV